MAALAASPTPQDDTDRRIAALTEHFEAGRTVKAVDAALQAACASADEAPRPRITLRLKTTQGAVECWVLETHDAVAHAFRCNQEGADADVAASMEMALATFLRLAARRLKTSRAVLAGQCKASGHRRSLERWGPVLTDAKKRLADALDLKAPPPSVIEKKGWFRRRSRDWRCAVSALKSQTVGGRLLPVSERWHPHLYALEVAVDTGIPGLLGYGLFFVFLGRRLFDARPEVALSSLVVILALFPLNSSVSFYSYFNGNILFLTLALLIALDRDLKPLPQLDPVHEAPSG